MAKIKYQAWEVKLFSETEEGRKYLEYNDKIGGEPIGLTVPYGYPCGVMQMGGVIAVYEKCIELGLPWEELLGSHPPEDAVL